MEKEISKSDWLFLLSCFILGIIAEESFFRGVEIGISYLVFVLAFYFVFYWRYRHFSFSHQRLGWLILICIWLLAIGYFIQYTPFFYVLNILVIPFLVILQLLLITSPRPVIWNHFSFIVYGFFRIIEAIKYTGWFVSALRKNTKEGIDRNHFIIIKKVIVGLLLSLPVLVVVLTLLMSADTMFKKLVGGFPDWLSVINTESIARIIIILVLTVAFFGFMQVLITKQIKIIEKAEFKPSFSIDGIIVLTFLGVMDLVYLLFTFVQFKYFFGGTLQGDLTFAQYARKGFFELLFVSVINLSVLTIVLTFVKKSTQLLFRINQVMLTIMVISSTVILCSAFIRLGMYEEAYGFTFIRILAHSFMIFLTIIFAFTLVKIWLDQLSLGHFFFISAIVYYSVINTIDLNKIVVSKNMARFEQSGKIDIQYLNSLSYTGILGLISLYEKGYKIPNLSSILAQRKLEFSQEKEPWQSFNLKKEEAKRELSKLKLSNQQN